jgi:cytochrome c553
MALASYSTSPAYSLIAMSLIGHDSNPNDGATPSSGSNGWSLESIVTPSAWLHLDARYERTNDGLGTVQNNYVGDVAFSIMPNLVVTLENVSSVGTTPVTSYQLLWAGPWIQRRGAAQAGEVTSPGSQGLALGQKIYAANCAQCHGANGGGGVGPSLHGIATRKTLDETVAFIENPSGIMPRLYPATLSTVQVQEVATFIRDTFR